MDRIVINVTARNKKDAIAALKIAIEVIEKRYYPGEVVEAVTVEDGLDISDF